MMKVILILLSLGLSQATTVITQNDIEESQSNEKVTINLYYETLCPDCKVFISQKLCPLLVTLRDYLAIEFVPYGNAETNVSKTGDISIECQHGPRECKANRIQSCSLVHLSYEQSTKFICCMEGKKKIESAAQACSKEVGIDFSPISKCAEGPEGNKLHYENGIKTSKLKPEHNWVPWILYNGVYNKDDMERSEDDLLSVVCDHLSDPKPRQCNEV